MKYEILPYTYKKAKELGVVVKPSKNTNKKIDVFNKKGKKIASIGATGYKDYPTYLKLEAKGIFPKGYAENRRKLYKARHKNNRNKRNTAGWFADKLLW